MTKLLVALISALLTTSAIAGLVEINSSQYIRESGSPSAQTLEVTLENDGEIRISNINLQDADFELSGSTQIYLNGSAILSPFQVPYGGYAVFPLSAGTHYLEVTLRGKPGGGLEVAFYENKPDAPRAKGWELLDDGTVRDRSTGLIWHRNPNTPGKFDGQNNRSRHINIQWNEDKHYIEDLNYGVFGEDPVNGNAGYADWRIPTALELNSLIAYDRGDDDCSVFDENLLCLDPIMLSNSRGDGPHRFGDPFFINNQYRDWREKGDGFDQCSDHTYTSSQWMTRSLREVEARGLTPCGEGSSCNRHVIDLYWGPYAISWYSPCVWPVRGGTPE